MNGIDLPDDFYQKPSKKAAFQMINSFFKPLLIGFCESVINEKDGIEIEANPESLIDIFWRFDERRLYFHIFHEGMKPNQHKCLALTVYWIVKLKPLRVKFLSDEYSAATREFESTVNENFAVYIVRAFLEHFYKGLKLPDEYLEELRICVHK